jgi:hypothetical protein
MSADQPLAKTLLALNNAHAQELSWLEPEGWRIPSNKLFSRDGSETLTPFCWRSITMRTTTAPISCGSAHAIHVLSMWTGSWSQHRREGAAARADFITICSNTLFEPGTTALSARSIRARRTQCQTLSMPH